MRQDEMKVWFVRAEPKPPWDKCDRSIHRCPLPTKEEVFFEDRYGKAGAKSEAQALAQKWAKGTYKYFYIIRYGRKTL